MIQTQRDVANLLGLSDPFYRRHDARAGARTLIGNRPLLFIYRPEFLVKDLGSVENVRAAFGKMRQACREAGFDGDTAWLIHQRQHRARITGVGSPLPYQGSRAH